MGLVTVWLEKLTRTVHSIVREVKAASRWRCQSCPVDVPVTEPLGEGAVQVLLKQLTTAK